MIGKLEIKTKHCSESKIRYCINASPKVYRDEKKCSGDENNHSEPQQLIRSEQWPAWPQLRKRIINPSSLPVTSMNAAPTLNIITDRRAD